MFYLNSTLNFGIPQVLVFQLEVCYRVDRLLTGITAQQKGTPARWYSNKTSLSKENRIHIHKDYMQDVTLIIISRHIILALILVMVKVLDTYI